MAGMSYNQVARMYKRDRINQQATTPANAPAFGPQQQPTNDYTLAQVMAQLRRSGTQMQVTSRTPRPSSVMMGSGGGGGGGLQPAAGGSGGFSSGGGSQGSNYQPPSGGGITGIGQGSGLYSSIPPLQTVVPTIQNLQNTLPGQTPAGIAPRNDNQQGNQHIGGMQNNQLPPVQPNANGDWADPNTGRILHGMTPNGDGTWTGTDDAGQQWTVNQMGNIGHQGLQTVVPSIPGTYSSIPGTQMLQTVVPTQPGLQSAPPNYWLQPPMTQPPAGGGGGGFGSYYPKNRNGGGTQTQGRMSNYLGNTGLVNWNI